MSKYDYFYIHSQFFTDLKFVYVVGKHGFCYCDRKSPIGTM